MTASPPDSSESIVIFALGVGGGILSLSPMPGAGGDFKGDIDHIASWTPAMVISLVTDIEMFAGGAQDLGSAIQDKGTRWVHMPIKDMETPDEAAQESWAEISAQARKAMAGGGRVLVHCLGGCGRSGMVALRLMIEAGEAPDEALARLRGVRACAIETEAQLAWAMAADREAAQFVRHAD